MEYRQFGRRCGLRISPLSFGTITLGSDSPMGRPGQPALAPFVLLASQESSYATGQVYGAAGDSGNP